jgi:hypothetical protein
MNFNRRRRRIKKNRRTKTDKHDESNDNISRETKFLWASVWDCN